ncbi:hypothetical protein AB0O95_10695 [Rhodoglobus sp. NPDC076762]
MAASGVAASDPRCFADEMELIGCVYIDPSEDETADADISWWVRDEYVGTELEAALNEFVPAWIERDWPLANPRFDLF